MKESVRNMKIMQENPKNTKQTFLFLENLLSSNKERQDRLKKEIDQIEFEKEEGELEERLRKQTKGIELDKQGEKQTKY